MPDVHLTRIGAHAARIEIDNPPANALGSALRRRFLEHLDALDADPGLRAVVVTGRGGAFCSGDDLKEQEAVQTQGAAARKALLGEFASLLARIEAFRAPVIAAIGGWCMGGGLELALACDIRIASTEAKLVCAGVNIGLMASAWRLPRAIGMARAKHMLLTGLPQDAATAERHGLVTAVHEPDTLQEAATRLAERIATRAPLSVEATKRVASLPPAEGAAAAAAEMEALVRSADHAEALAAFREKREPRFGRK
ncbi:MAG TPA: enoyl-CoA hydratase/isomerase family protein [Rhizomicrobium sp.]|nr:enoyl-CoA hydratase/isomerase family protein [Rhizomicrobium sp.]